LDVTIAMSALKVSHITELSWHKSVQVQNRSAERVSDYNKVGLRDPFGV
jgi:hypothetical protein